MSSVSIGNATTTNIIQQPTVTDQAAVARPGANRRANVGGVAASYLQNLRAPREVRTTRFNNPLCAVVRAGRAAVDAVRARFSAIKAAYVAHRQEVAQRAAAESQRVAAERALPGQTFTFTHPQTGRTFSWSGSLFKDMIASLPKNQRMAAINDLPQIIQNRINNGSRVYAQVTGSAGGGVPEANAQNIADFTLYMYAAAASQGDTFSHGSFNIGDPDGKLAGWLDSSTEVYARSSSHLKGIQEQMITDADGKPHQNKPRGIDIPPSLQSGLPAEFKTITYGTITPMPGSGGARRLFLKAESFGCRISTFSLAHLAKTRLAISGVKSRDWRTSDIGAALGHIGSFFATRGQQGAAGSRKEHFPGSVAKVLNKWKKTDLSDATPETREMFAKITGSKCQDGGFGLRRLSAKMAEVGSQNPADPRVQNFLTELEHAIDALPHHDRLDVRLGNEVIID